MREHPSDGVRGGVMIGHVSLAAALGYEHRRANSAQRAIQRFAGTRAGAWLFSKILRRADHLVLDLTGGRRTATECFAGLPVILLTTAGVLSGSPTTTPVLGMPIADAIAVAGANFGQRLTPRWALSLAMHHSAIVSYRNARCPVRARAATDVERMGIAEIGRRIYPGSAKYVERVTWRRIPIFVLEMANEPAPLSDAPTSSDVQAARRHRIPDPSHAC